jgi:hypothetical protein
VNRRRERDAGDVSADTESSTAVRDAATARERERDAAERNGGGEEGHRERGGDWNATATVYVRNDEAAGRTAWNGGTGKDDARGAAGG